MSNLIRRCCVISAFFFSLALQCSLGFAEDAEKYFLVQYSPGANWDTELDYQSQPGLIEHHNYLQELNHHQQLILAGPILNDKKSSDKKSSDKKSSEMGSSESGAMSLLRVTSMVEARRLISSDPGIMAKVLAAKIVPWQITVSSKRLVNRAKTRAVIDPEQTYRLKRVDPESQVKVDEE